MEITTGAVLARYVRTGGRAVLLHLTLGEGGNPRLSPKAYGEQKRREAVEAARILGAQVLFGPYRDGELPDNDEARRFVANVIRQVKPTLILTHWRTSMHKDHEATYRVAKDAVLLAALEGVQLEHPAWRGVRGVYFAENWEDPEDFKPYLYINVTGDLAKWEEAVTKYEFIRGGVASFPYLAYYRSLAGVRGAEARATHAVAFEQDPWSKRRVLDGLP
jgi:LmbE family N-acetylglucosaminyl deacetylase